MSSASSSPAAELLGPAGWGAARDLVRRVRAAVPARLELAALFGSRARGEARPDSDLDLLLLFDRLPPDREPHATHAERMAERVAAESGVPLAVWSVSREDLVRGWRTPMLVDALDDALPVWPSDARIPRVRFTRDDASFCIVCLLDRVAEGSREVARLRRRGDLEGAAERARDDVVRLCTALLLADGETRPRRSDAVRRVRRLFPELARDPILVWAERSYLGDRIADPPGWGAVAATVERLRGRLLRARGALGTGAGLATRG